MAIAETVLNCLNNKIYAEDAAAHELYRLLREEGIEMIAPHKGNRRKPATQDGRVLRCYRRRWKIERLDTWLQNFRRIATRFDFHAENYLASFISVASRFCFAAIYETASKGNLTAQSFVYNTNHFK